VPQRGDLFSPMQENLDFLPKSKKSRTSFRENWEVPRPSRFINPTQNAVTNFRTLKYSVLILRIVLCFFDNNIFENA